MRVAWKMFFCFCLEFDRLNYCKHSLFLCLRNWMENSIVYCWMFWKYFGQMYINLAVMAFKTKKLWKWPWSIIFSYLNSLYVLKIHCFYLEKTISVWKKWTTFAFLFFVDMSDCWGLLGCLLVSIIIFFVLKIRLTSSLDNHSMFYFHEGEGNNL